MIPQSLIDALQQDRDLDLNRRAELQRVVKEARTAHEPQTVGSAAGPQGAQGMHWLRSLAVCARRLILGYEAPCFRSAG